jgi:hypothetical protein
MTTSPTIPAQTLTIKRTWYPCSVIAWTLSSCQKWVLWMLNTPKSIHRLSTECYVKGTDPYCVDVPAIRKFASVEVDETDVRSAGSGMDAILRNEVLRGPFFGTVISRELLHSCNYGIFIAWCPYSLWTTCIRVCRRCYTSCLTETLLQSLKHISVDDVGLLPRSSTSSTVTDTEGHMSQYKSCVYSMITRSLGLEYT